MPFIASEFSLSKDAASHIQVERLLTICSEYYFPNLQSSVESADYSKKLLTFSSRFEAFNGANLIALVAIYCNDPLKKESFISNVCTHPLWAGKGIASALLDFGIKSTASLGFNFMTLEVHRENQPAISLYLKNGFKKISEESNKIKMKVRLSHDN